MANEQRINDIIDIAAITKQVEATEQQLGRIVATIAEINKSGVTFKAPSGGGIPEATKQIDELGRANQRLANLQTDAGKTAYQLTESTKELTKQEKLQAQATNEQAGAYARLKAQAELATKQARDLSAQYGINSKQAKEASLRANEYNTKLKNIDATMNIHNKNVGNYASANEGLIGKFKGLAIAIPIVALAIKGVSMAWNTYKKAIATTETAMDEFSFTMEGMNKATKAFFKTIYEGDWSNLIDNMTEAYKRGHDYAETMDLIAHQTAANTANLGLESKAISELEEKMKNKTLSDKERLQAARDLLVLKKQYYDNEITLSNKTLEAQLKLMQIDKETAIAYVTTDANNLNLRKQAEDYNKLIDERNNLLDAQKQYQEKANIVTSRGTVIARTDQSKLIKENKDALSQYSQEIIDFANVIRKVESSSPENVKKLVEAITKTGQSQAALYNENKRIITQTHTLEKSIEDDRKKAHEAYIKRLEDKRKADLKQFQDMKMTRYETNYFTAEQNKLIDSYMSMFKKIEWAKRNNINIPYTEDDIEIIGNSEKSMEELAAIFNTFSNNVNNGKISSEDFVNSLKELTDIFQKLFDIESFDFIDKSLVNAFKVSFSEIANIADVFVENDLTTAMQKAVVIVNGFANIMQSVFQAIDSNLTESVDRNLKRLDEQYAKNEKNLKNQLDQGIISQQDYDGKLAILQEEKAAREKQLNHDAFEKQKQVALTNAAIMGIEASLAAYVSGNKMGGPTVGSIYAAIAGLFAVIQAGLIASKPNPYWTGRWGGPEETAITGDRGFEYISDSTGLFKTPNQPTLTHLKAGATVFPHDISLQIDKMLHMPAVSNVTKVPETQQNKNIEKLLTDIKNKPSVNLNVNKNGLDMYIHNGHSRSKFVNKHIMGYKV